MALIVTVMIKYKKGDYIMKPWTLNIWQDDKIYDYYTLQNETDRGTVKGEC